MDRRGFLKGIIGLASTAALPDPALDFLTKTESLPNDAFVAAAYNDEAIIRLMELRIAQMSKDMMQMLDESLYKDFLNGR